MFTIFGNIRISSPERVERLMLCLSYLERVKAARWVLNIRGAYKLEAAAMVSSLGLQQLTVSHYETDRGWCADTFDLLRNEPSEFIVCLIEDQFFVANPLILEKTIEEMRDRKLDHLVYTWFSPIKRAEAFVGIEHEEGTYTASFELNIHTNIMRHKNQQRAQACLGHLYAVSLASIIRTELLVKICANYREQRRRYSKLTPFDAERSNTDIDLFPIRTGVPKLELFASLDDDSSISSSSLQSRGVHTDICARAAIRSIETEDNSAFRFIYFRVGQEITQGSETVLGFRIYNYLRRHQEVAQNINHIFGTFFAAMSFAMQLVPSVDFLYDYESVSGSICLFFNKAFGRKRFNFRSVSDHQAVLAHEYFFLMHIYSGFQSMYLDQEVTIGTPERDGDFLLYADYTKGEGSCESSEGGSSCLLFLDTTAPNVERLSSAVRSNLQSAPVNVVIVYGDISGSSFPSPALATYGEIIMSEGFTVVWSRDFSITLKLESETDQVTLKRCLVYKRNEQ